MSEAILRGKSSDPKARAAGYNHTYFDNTGLDILTLSRYPSQDEIQEIAVEASEEAVSLVALLGISPVRLRSAQRQPQSIPSLPSITAGFPSEPLGEDEDVFSAEEEVGITSQIQAMFDREEDKDNRPAFNTQEEKEIKNLTCAAASLLLEQESRMYVSSSLHGVYSNDFLSIL